jgi:YidC/Oxa1 family membrane protein insertase
LHDVFSPLIKFFEAILVFFHDTVGLGWGWAIVALTVLVRAALMPLTIKQFKSMQNMAKFQPEIKKLQERYKGDKQRMNQEVMAFYQREKVNPLGSCLPLALQIPFFISLFSLLRSDSFQADIASNPGFGPIDNLAENVTEPVLLGVLIVLYVGTQLAASAVTALSADPTQRRIMFALPFVFVVFIINFPAGLIVYWITTNVWTIGQQLLVKKLYPKPALATAGAALSGGDGGTPARGKPPSPAATASAGNGSGDKPAKAEPKPKAKATAGGDGEPVKAPPRSPRKKKKRSGRRR